VTPSIIELRPEDTAPLRRSVLRDGTLSDAVEFEGDDDASTFHLGATLGDRIVAVSTWMRRPWPNDPDRAAVQLRGMATDPAYRGRGLGDRLLGAGVERCRSAGASIVWARARDTALDFYTRRGFVAVGDGFVDETTGLPHHVVVRDLG
jgi:GNAT superfamily N-acetyltransferase